MTQPAEHSSRLYITGASSRFAMPTRTSGTKPRVCCCGVLAHLGWETQQNADNTRLGLVGSQASLEVSHAAVKVAQANLALDSPPDG